MLDPRRPVDVAVHAGAVPLPGRVEVRDPYDAAQVAAAVRVAGGFTVPVVGPVPLIPALAPGLICGVVGRNRDFLPEPQRMASAVEALERHELGERPQALSSGRSQPAPNHS